MLIPKKAENLAFGLMRKLSKFDDREEGCINSILPSSRSSNLEVLARSKNQIFSLLGYILRGCFLLALLFLSGCGNAPYRSPDVLGASDFVIDSYKIKEGKFSILQLEGKESDELALELLDDYQDSIQEGDSLEISVYHPMRQDMVDAVHSIGSRTGFTVREGKITLPDLEPIYIEHLTLEEARTKIQNAYHHHIKDIQVFLSYKDRSEKKVELLGLVQTSSIPVNGKTRLFDILSLAKVPPNANLFKSYVIRDNQMVPVDLYKLVKEGDMSQNIVMRGGDKVYIAEPSASSLMVLGEVGREGVIDMPNGFMSIRHALAAAGGIPYTGNKSYIQVIRGNIVNPKVYTLTWNHIVRLPTDSLLLMPGDIVYVATSPITEWNRFVTQLLPTLMSIDLVTRGANNIGVNIP